MSTRPINQRLNIKCRDTSERSDCGDGLSVDSDTASCLQQPDPFFITELHADGTKLTFTKARRPIFTRLRSRIGIYDKVFDARIMDAG